MHAIEEGNASATPRFIPVTQWSKYHAWPPIGGLRHLIFYSKDNGFDSCLVRVGRRVLIDESRFFSWVDSQRKAGGLND